MITLMPAIDGGGAKDEKAFSQLQALMQANGIPTPSEADIDARTARRIKQQAKKKQWFDHSPKASDFTLAGGFSTTRMGVRRAYCHPSCQAPVALR